MVRYLEQSEKQKIRPLYQACFDDMEEYCDYYFEKRLPQNEVAVCEKDTSFTGMIHLIPKTIGIGHEFITQCHYLYAVATAPEFRKQGVMGQILRRVLWDLHNAGELFTYLIPSSEENAQIYRKYGFARVMNKHTLKDTNVRMNRLPGIRSYRAKREDIPALSAFAQRKMAENYAIYISKNIHYFEKMMELMEIEDGEITIFEKEGSILGYRIGSEDDVLEEVLEPEISALAWESSESEPYTMARVLKIPKMLERVSTTVSGHIYIEVMDSVIEENNGVFLWEYGAGGCCWRKVENQKAEIHISVEAFTAHLMGYKRIERLPEMDVKQGFYMNDYV